MNMFELTGVIIGTVINSKFKEILQLNDTLAVAGNSLATALQYFQI